MAGAVLGSLNVVVNDTQLVFALEVFSRKQEKKVQWIASKPIKKQIPSKAVRVQFLTSVAVQVIN